MQVGVGFGVGVGVGVGFGVGFGVGVGVGLFLPAATCKNDTGVTVTALLANISGPIRTRDVITISR